MLLASKATMFCKVLNQFQIPIEVALDLILANIPESGVRQTEENLLAS